MYASSRLRWFEKYEESHEHRDCRPSLSFGLTQESSQGFLRAFVFLLLLLVVCGVLILLFRWERVVWWVLRWDQCESLAPPTSRLVFP